MHQQKEGSGGSGGWVEAGIHVLATRPNLLPDQNGLPAQHDLASWANDPAARHKLANQAGPEGPDGLAMLTHDIRNMVAALELYCDLLAEPGVLNSTFVHYARELRLVAAASRQLIEKIATLERRERISGASSGLKIARSPAQKIRSASALPFRTNRFGSLGETRLTRLARPARFANLNSVTPATHLDIPQSHRFFAPAEPVANLAEELLASQNLLAAMAGPGITLGLTLPTAAERMAALALIPNLALEMTRDDLTRILINLVRNAADAMPAGGHIQIALSLLDARLLLTVTDTGPGIPSGVLQTIFAAGFSTRIGLGHETSGKESWAGETGEHRGLGLAIVRAIVVAAGGRVRAENCPAGKSAPSGACLYLEFPSSNCAAGHS